MPDASIHSTLGLADGSLQLTGRTLGNPETALGECLLALKRYAEAGPLLLSGYKKLRERPESHDALTEAAVRRLHDLYTAWNKPAEAARFTAGETREDHNRP